MEAILNNMYRNRKFFIVEFMTGMGQFTLITGAFLAGFIHMLGGSDSLNGTMGAIPAVMGFMQIASALYMERLTERKKPVVALVVLLRILLGLVFILPIMFMSTGISLNLFISLYILGFALNALVAPAISDWLVNSTPTGIRGRYFAQRERYGFILTVIISFGAGQILDWYDMRNAEAYGFLIVGATVMVFGLINVASMAKMVEINHEYVPSKYSFLEGVALPFRNKAFRKVILLFFLWGVGLQMGGPFIAVYMISHLELSYSYIMAMTIAGTIVRLFAATFWGSMADNKSWFLTAEGALVILALSHMSWAFVTVENMAYMIPVLSVTSGFAWGGIGLSLFNIQFIFAPIKGRTIYIAVNAAVSGIVSFGAVRLSSYIVDHMEGRPFVVHDMTFSGIQTVIFLSSLVLLIMPFYIRFALEKQVVETK